MPIEPRPPEPRPSESRGPEPLGQRPTGQRPALAGVVFDMDGTLVDSEPLYAESDREFLASFGIFLEEAEMARYVGIGTRDFFRELEAAHPASPLHALPLEERIRLKDEAFLMRAGSRLAAFPGPLALARELSRRGVPLALASGSSPAVIEAAIGAIGAIGLFAALVSASELPKGKPDPAVFLEAARRLGLEAEACAAIEDSLPGLVAARTARMRCVALPSPGTEEGAFRDADLVVRGGAAALDPVAALELFESWGLSARARS